MFKHSTKVPRLYKVSAKVAKEVKEGIGSIKSRVYEHKKKHPNIKAIYALVSTLSQNHEEIESILKKSEFFTKEPRADPWLTKILLVELLWGKRRISGDSVPEKTIQAYEQIFKAHFTNTPVISRKNETQGDLKPRYVRVNTLFISLDEAVEGFRNEGWKLCKFFDKTDYTGFLRKIASLEEDEFLIDIHVPNLLIFPPKTEFYKHPAYQDGSIILQDKASCLPVHILNPPSGSIVLDMCAAPGMKTTQLAALMNDQGTVYAVERNPKRFETLNRIIESSKATSIKTENKDVLTCSAADFKGVQYILVDPSCSGSGMTDRLECEQMDNDRIQKLAGFQIKILRSALTRYPDVKRVVYSTCSIYPEENEDVVRQVIETNTKFKLVPAKPFVNDTWQNVGSSDYGEIGNYCLYAKPYEDLTNGFFVAVFERLEEGEENQFFNTKVYNYKKHVQSQENRKKRRQEAIENTGYYGNDFRNEITNEVENNSSYGIEDGNQRNIAEYDNQENRESFMLEENLIIKKKKKNKLSQTLVNDDLSVETENYGEKKSEQKPIQHTEEKLNVNYEDIGRKKKKRKKDSDLSNDCLEPILDQTVKNIRTNTKISVNETENLEYLPFLSQESIYIESDKRKKKKKKKDKDVSVNEITAVVDVTDRVEKKSKKKRSRSSENESHENTEIFEDSSGDLFSMEQKKKEGSVDVDFTEGNDENRADENNKRKRKHSIDKLIENSSKVKHKKNKSNLHKTIDSDNEGEEYSDKRTYKKQKVLSNEDGDISCKSKIGFEGKPQKNKSFDAESEEIQNNEIADSVAKKNKRKSKK